MPGPERAAPTERERETDQRPLWLMLLPCAVLLALAFVPGALVKAFLGDAMNGFVEWSGNIAAGPPHEAGAPASFAPIVLTLALVAFTLVRQRATRRTARTLFEVEMLPFRALEFLHSGLVGDYVLWIIVGLAALVVVVGTG